VLEPEAWSVSMLVSKEPPLALHCFSLATSLSKTPPLLWAPTNPQPLHRTGFTTLDIFNTGDTPPARQLAIISPWTPQALMTGMSQSHGAAHLLHSPIKQQGSSPPHPHLQLCACSCPMPSSHACTSPCPTCACCSPPSQHYTPWVALCTCTPCPRALHTHCGTSFA